VNKHREYSSDMRRLFIHFYLLFSFRRVNIGTEMKPIACDSWKKKKTPSNFGEGGCKILILRSNKCNNIKSIFDKQVEDLK
jgi:hypothetical protein